MAGHDEPRDVHADRHRHKQRVPDHHSEREFFIDSLLVRIHYIIGMISWTGLAPWEFEFPFPGSLTTTVFLSELRT